MSPPLPARRYEQVAARLADAISRGSVAPGDRLASVRDLARAERVSPATAVRAFLRLEELGLVEARPQAGHFVRAPAPAAAEPGPSRPSGRPRAPTVAGLVREVYGAGRDPRLVSFATSGPGAGLLPVARLARLAGRVARIDPARAAGYEMPPGALELRRALARRSVGWGCALGPEELVATCGAAQAIQLALQAVTRPGDAVAVESPAYFGTLQAIGALGLRALELPTHPRDGLDLDALEAAMARTPVAAVLVVANFGNPLGSLMPDEAKARLATLAARRGVPVIEDDLLGDLHFGPTRPRTVKSFDRAGQVLLCGSVSKTLSPGARVGWIAPGRFRERVELLQYAQAVAAPTLPQLVVAEVLRSGGYDRHLRSLRRALALQAARAAGLVREHFPGGTRATRPQGGPVLWIELPRGVDALEVHRRALEAGVAVAPGPIFSTERRYQGCIRVNYGEPFTPAREAALARVGRIAAHLS